MTVDVCRSDSLELILTDQTNHPDYESIVHHLSHCTRCQQRLDELAAQPSWWSDARRHLKEPFPANVDDLPATETLVSAELETAPTPDLAEIRPLLAPPRHPEMLGRIGKYEIESEIGRGGMGIVLKGFDTELNRPVAVKLLAPHLASNGTARQRFVREARAAAAVVHENVVAIHGIETDGALPSIVMPYISGLSLQQYIEQNGALEPVDVVRIGIQIASGLAAAHDQGLVHRDIKPANVILENGINRVQITDFGLARAAHEAELTRTGIIAGTPAFMSPEQSLSESIDQRSDLFSLGSVLYYAATGRLPFRASTPIGVLQQVCNGVPTRPCEENPQIPALLESVIEKLLAKAPADRFQNAIDLRKYLTEYLAYLQQPTTAAAPRRLTTPSSRTRTKRLWQRVALAVGLPLLTAAVGMILFRSSTPPAGSPPPSSTETVQDSIPSQDLLTEIISVPTASEIDTNIGELQLLTVDAEQTAADNPVRSRADQADSIDSELRSLTAEVMFTESSSHFVFEPFRSSPAPTGADLERLRQDIRRLEQSH